MQINIPALHRINVLWVEQEHLDCTETELEGEGPEVWEDVLWKGDLSAGVHLQAVASVLSS